MLNTSRFSIFMDTVKDRLLFLIEKEGLNPNKFYIRSGLSNGYIDKVGDKINKSTREKIEKAFPHWNIYWILTGEGEMLNSNYNNGDQAFVGISGVNIGRDNTGRISFSRQSDNREDANLLKEDSPIYKSKQLELDSLKSKNKMLQKEIEFKEKEIEFLKKSLEEKERLIQVLMNMK